MLRHNQTLLPRQFSNSVSQVETEDKYVSPFQDFFDMINDNKISSGKDADDYSVLAVKVLRCGVKESDLRFKTVAYGRSYLAPYVLPHEHKVTLKVNVRDISFGSETEKKIFFQIVGKRYLPKTDELTLISTQFASRIENKRHTVSMLERIMESAKILSNEVSGDHKLSIV